MNLEDYAIGVRNDGLICFKNLCPLGFVAVAHEVAETVLDPASEKMREYLTKLGWAPPGEKAKVRMTKEGAGAACRLMFDYDNLSIADSQYDLEISVPFCDSGTFSMVLSAAELRTSIDRQKKEAQDALAKLGIEYP